MPFYKLTMNFTLRNQGWTEQYYFENAGTPTRAQVIATYGPIVQERATALAAGATLNGYSWRLEGGTRKALTVGTNYSPAALVANRPDVTSTSAVLTLSGSAPDGPVRRNVWVRGLRDDWVLRSVAGVDEPHALLLAWINNYVVMLRAADARIKNLDTSDPAVSTFIPVLRVDPFPAPAGYTQVTLNEVLNGNPNEFVRFRGIPVSIAGWFRSTNKLLSFDAPGNVWRIDTAYQGAAGGELTAGLSIAMQRYRYTAIDEAPEGYFLKFGKRDTGRPITAERGRRSARRFLR